MSLFDVIRYPINDIFDTDELDKLPISILKDWISECVDIVQYGYPYKNLPRPDWGVVILHLIHGYLLCHDAKKYTDMEREIIQESLKIKFTALLKKRIENYDGE